MGFNLAFKGLMFKRRPRLTQGCRADDDDD
jgi:hypothetical protein